MSDIDAYLERYYRTADQLAAVCSISTDELAGLVNERLVPAPSYTVSNGVLVSQAFGEFKAQALRPGQYFHPSNAAWVALACEAKRKAGAQQAHLELKQRFRGNFASALAELDKALFRLPDSFTDTGQVIPHGLDARTEDAWRHFLKGVFSLCVADPSSERSIALKEVLQEALATLSENGSKADFPPAQRRHVLDLIDRYAKAAMPFSPLEYPSSSRKRLVEDLRAKLDVLDH